MIFILIMRKRTAGLYLILFVLALLLPLTSYSLAGHPNMENWKKEQIVVDKVDTDQKVVALTFDDGPDPEFTPLVLEALKKHKAKATFFVMGKRAELYSPVVERIAAEGHEIGNHSYSHPDFNKADRNTQLAEITQTNKIIKRISGQEPQLFRPPGGYLSYDLVDMVKENNMTIAYWTYQQDSKDWRNGVKAAAIAKKIVTNIRPGQVIILHDGCSNGKQTAQAIEILIPRLEEDGYRFITMSDLIKLEKK